MAIAHREEYVAASIFGKNGISRRTFRVQPVASRMSHQLLQEGKMKKRTPKSEQKKVDQWNARYPIGQSVDLLKDGGEIMRTKTRSAAAILSGHTAVIWLENVSGCYIIDRVTAVSHAQP